MRLRPTVRRRTLALVAALTIAVTAAGCTSPEEPDASPAPSPSASESTTAAIDFAVYGPPQVTTAYTRLAAAFSRTHPGVTVNVTPYPTHEAAMTGLESARAKGSPPDLFLMDRSDLARLSGDDALRRVDDLLGERRVDFGDGYSRNALEAFSAESALQCMPADLSPMVVYYNPRLIDLTTVAEPGRNAVDQDDGWSLEEFAAAAAQPRARGVRGLYVAPSLEQVAPFIWSEGGDLVDDQDEPTTLELSQGGSETAMEELLELVRDPGLTFNQTALRKRSALERFKAGRLGMMLGYRDLTPVLRQQEDLVFDVMPLPRLSQRATAARLQGLCISQGTEQAEATADLLTYLVSDASAETLAATGYAMPTNVEVLNTESFRQTDQRPAHPEVFVSQSRYARTLPGTTTWPAVEAAAGLALTDLFYQPVIEPLQARLEAIDEASKAIFDPTAASESPSPGESPTSSPTGTPGEG